MEVDLAQGRGGELGIVMIVISTCRVVAECIGLDDVMRHERLNIPIGRESNFIVFME
jgi:hypothetical protein